MIRLYDDRVEFHNGLRHVQLKWDEVERVRVFPVRWGKKVQVFGKSSFFEYRTLGEVRVQGELKGRLGFDQGEEILRQIILNAGLQIAENQAEEYYYVRK